MFAQLGNIQFELLPITGLDERFSYDYAEHAVIEGKPLLQFIGDRLDEANLSIRFHHIFCDPSRQFEALKAEAARHEALPFLFASGRYLGRYVITEIDKTTIATTDDGRPLNIEVRLTLREFFHPAPLEAVTQAKRTSAPGLQGRGPLTAKPSYPGNKAALIGGQIKTSAKQIGRDATRMGSLAGQLSAGYASAAAQISSAAAQIRTAVAPVMAQAQAVAAGVQGAAATLQSQVTAISGLSSDIARITSGLPYPGNLLGNRIAALNRRVSAKATEGITLTSLIQGGAIEAKTRAHMIAGTIPS